MFDTSCWKSWRRRVQTPKAGQHCHRCGVALISTQPWTGKAKPTQNIYISLTDCFNFGRFVKSLIALQIGQSDFRDTPCAVGAQRLYVFFQFPVSTIIQDELGEHKYNMTHYYTQKNNTNKSYPSCREPVSIDAARIRVVSSEPNRPLTLMETNATPEKSSVTWTEVSNICASDRTLMRVGLILRESNCGGVVSYMPPGRSIQWGDLAG